MQHNSETNMGLRVCQVSLNSNLHSTSGLINFGNSYSFSERRKCAFKFGIKK